jgi:hypothetical protein
MPFQAVRWFAGLLIGIGAVFLVIGVGQVRLSLGLSAEDSSHEQLRWTGALLFLGAGLLTLAVGIRLMVTPQRWHAYPFLARSRFWRWLVAGVMTIFFLLAVGLEGELQARLVCRSLCAFWLALLLSPLLWPPRALRESARVWSMKAVRWSDLAVGNLVLIVLLAEGALRLWATTSDHNLMLLSKATGFRMTPGVYENGLRANSLGFADEEFQVVKRPGVPRIAALGDSFSVGVRVAYEDNYLTLLEQKLPGVEVYNFGVSGTGPREYHALLSTVVWTYQPDLVLLPIFVGNDITQWIYTPELTKFHPESFYVQFALQRMFKLVRERCRWSAENHECDYRMGIPPAFSEEGYLSIEASRVPVCQIRDSSFLRQRWQDVYHHLGAIISDCRARGVPVAVALLPDEFQVNDELRRRAMAVRQIKEADIDVLLPQRRLAQFCADRQVPCLDLYPQFAPVGSAAYHPNDSHWNARGNHIAADTLARWLRDETRLVP